jgi:hypothetical protein
MSVVVACKMILQTVSLISLLGTDPVGICIVSLWRSTLIEIELLGCIGR